MQSRTKDHVLALYLRSQSHSPQCLTGCVTSPEKKQSAAFPFKPATVLAGSTSDR